MQPVWSRAGSAWELLLPLGQPGQWQQRAAKGENWDQRRHAIEHRREGKGMPRVWGRGGILT